jgi:sec-independent protein translocase protein TatB
MLLRKLGQFLAKLRGMASEFRASFDEMARQSELDELRKEVEAMRSGQLTDMAAKASGLDSEPAIDEINQGLADVGVQLHPPMSYQYEAAAVAEEMQPVVGAASMPRGKAGAKFPPKSAIAPAAAPKAAKVKVSKPAPSKPTPSKPAPSKSAASKALAPKAAPAKVAAAKAAAPKTTAPKAVAAKPAAPKPAAKAAPRKRPANPRRPTVERG